MPLSVCDAPLLRVDEPDEGAGEGTGDASEAPPVGLAAAAMVLPPWISNGLTVSVSESVVVMPATTATMLQLAMLPEIVQSSSRFI